MGSRPVRVPRPDPLNNPRNPGLGTPLNCPLTFTPTPPRSRGDTKPLTPMKITSPLIQDNQSLVSAATRHGTPIPTYDDGFGELYIHRDSMGVTAIVRAQSWEGAYGICEDDFFPEATETWEEIVAEYGKIRERVKIIRRDGVERDCHSSDYPLKPWEFVRWETRETVPETEEEREETVLDNALFEEAFGYRPNGPRAGTWENGEPRDPIGHGIYAKDLNGDYLDLLTPELLERLEITLEIKDED